MEVAAIGRLKKIPQTCNNVNMLARSSLIESSSKLLITRTDKKAQMSLIWGRIRLLTSKLNISEISWPILIKFYMLHHCFLFILEATVVSMVSSVFMTPWPRPAGGIDTSGCPYVRKSGHISSCFFFCVCFLFIFFHFIVILVESSLHPSIA